MHWIFMHRCMRPMYVYINAHCTKTTILVAIIMYLASNMLHILAVTGPTTVLGR